MLKSTAIVQGSARSQVRTHSVFISTPDGVPEVALEFGALDSPIRSSITPHELYDFLMSLDDEKSVRLVQNNALLMPLKSVFVLLHIKHEDIWAAARKEKRFLPVPKTMVKLLEVPSRPIGRSAFTRFMKAAPNLDAVHALMIDQLGHDYSWPRASEWMGLFDSSFFKHGASKCFWRQFVKEATELNVERLRSGSSALRLLAVYARDPLVWRFGCSVMRPVLEQRLSELDEDSYAESDPILHRVYIADHITVLMRMLAWQVADMVVDLWEMVEQDGMENDIPLESILPTLDIDTHEWSDPMTSALQRLATRAGWKGRQLATTFLGNLWARIDLSRQVTATSRLRLLRNWVQRKKGRPQFESLLSLASAVTQEQAILKGLSPEGRENDAWFQAAILRVAEALSLIRPYLSEQGFSAEQIAGVFDSYAAEYRTARELLGKPMEAATGAASQTVS